MSVSAHTLSGSRTPRALATIVDEVDSTWKRARRRRIPASMRTTAFTLAALALLLGCTPTPASTTATAAPSSTAAPTSTRATDTFATKKGELKVTPIFHASVLLEVAGKAIYLDPFSKGDFTGLPKADFVLITDIHQDHLDPKALDAVSKPETRIVAPPAVAAELKGRPNVTVMENGQKQSLDLFDVEAVPMYNIERGPEPGKKFHDKGRGNGYVLTFGDKRFYFSGDTECTPEMKALASIDVAFVCMNLPYTMPPKEAAVCVNAFKPKVLFPYHYAVPGGASSNLDELKAAIDPQAGVEVRLRKWY
jgi:L-ascorbate metabolism protein UlaG (beta-lactamase superfamily)